MTLNSFYEKIDKTAEYLATLRDRYIEHYGKPVTFLSYVNSSTEPTTLFDDFNEPIDPRDTEVDTIEIYTKIIPLYNEYYALMDIYDISKEDNLPLEAMVKTTDKIPLGASVELDLRPSGTTETRKIVFEVIDSYIKHIDTYYQKVLKLSPRRGMNVEE